MVEVSRHEPGSFSWAELATSDPAAAKNFYSSLFGWNAVDSPMGPGPEDVYTRMQLAGKDVAALYKMMKDQAAMGVPPHWNVYFNVEDVDASVTQAEGLGAKTLAPAMDVPGVGRMAMLADPQGATFWVMAAADAA